MRISALALCVLAAIAVAAPKKPQKRGESSDAGTRGGPTPEQEAEAAFKAHPSLYRIETTAGGYRWFATDPGACACDLGAKVSCTRELDESLKSALAQQQASAKVACPPNAGCRPGFTRIFVECSKALK